MTANKKILVTGGAGFIGSHTVLALIEAGYLPIVIDNFSNSHSWIAMELENLAGQGIPVYEVDCTDEKKLAAVFDEEGPFEGVIHFAALKAVGESIEQPLKYYKNNLESLIRLLEQMERTDTKNLVFSSSCTVYGLPSIIPITEDEEIKVPQSPYSATKIIGEQIIRDVVIHGGKINGVLLRYFNPIGAHPSGKIGELPMGVPNNLVPYVSQTAAGWRDTIIINGNDYDTPDGTCIRDYIHVVDLAEAHVKALSWLSKGKSLDVFNLGTGKGSSVEEVISLFEEVSEKTIIRVIGPRRKGDVPAIWANADKAKTELGWEAKYSLKEALHHAWLWQENLNKKK